MDENSETPQPTHSNRAASGSMSATRTGTRTYIGRNDRGSTVLIGPAEVAGHFTPGELLKLAIAGCAAMSSDTATARRLGDGFTSTVWAHGTADAEENRYRTINEEIMLDLDGLSEEERLTLLRVIHRSIDASCTVARSVQDSIELTWTLNGEPL